VSDPFIEVLVDNKLYAETTVQEKTVNPGVQGANEEEILCNQFVVSVCLLSLFLA